MKQLKQWMILAVAALCMLPSFANALQVSRPSPGDSHIRFITFNPNAIHKYVGYYNYQASIVFELGEEIETITMGNPSAWQLVPSGYRLFLKPIADDPRDASTNMLVLTNKRTYHFILEAAETDNIEDPNLPFETRFVYPAAEDSAVQSFNTSNEPDLTEPDKYNFNYTISGSQRISPIKVFDDGEFTYFQFTKQNAELPAIFLVDSEGRESLINYRVTGSYVVVERVASQLTLRHGSDATCVFNETWPLQKLKDQKK